jgi:bacterioferritin-associated ferredoxin
MYVCICHGITDRQIRRAVDEGARSLTEVQMELPVGGCCGRCVDTAREIIRDHQCPSPALARAGSRTAEPALA